MDNEKYMNSYVEVLKNTLNEYFYANITLQTNQKFMESALKEQGEQIQKYMVMIANYEKENEEKSANESELLKQLKSENEKLKFDISDKENIVSQNQSKLDNAKIELRDEIQRLKNQIEHLNQVNSNLESVRNENANLKTEIEVLKQNIASAQSTQLAPKQINKSFVKKGLVQTQVEDGGNF